MLAHRENIINAVIIILNNKAASITVKKCCSASCSMIKATTARENTPMSLFQRSTNFASF